MIEIPVSIKQAIASYAHTKPTEEICGIVLNDSVITLPNQAPDLGSQADSKAFCRQNDFQLPVETLPKYGNNIKYIFHSHWRETSPALLTSTDINSSRKCRIPFLLYHTTFDQWDLWGSDFLHPFPLAKTTRSQNPKDLNFYLGWPWSWGRSDCLTLMRSYFKGMFDIHIDDFERVSTEREFQQRLESATWNDYDENLGIQGFEKIYQGSPPANFNFKIHDLILMTLQGRRPHHVGILVDPQKMYMIHHLGDGRFSEKSPYIGGRLRQTHSVWRHKSLK